MLALDIGIKHLAYCICDISDNKPIIRHWALVNLTNLENDAKPTCFQCSKPPKAKTPQGLVCGRHIPKDLPQIFDESTGLPIKKMPTIGQLQTFLRIKGLNTKGKRPELLERAEAVATMPLIKKKSVMSFADNTCNLHDAIRGWITRDWHHLSGVKHVYIEHQPVLKNPVMKTVQLLIFATLRERLLISGPQDPTQFHFVHAGKKVKGAEVGDAGYKDRKAGAEMRVKDYLSKFPMISPQQDWLRWWLSQAKKDDLADTLCMILDI
jgi:hypothetical protein